MSSSTPSRELIQHLLQCPYERTARGRHAAIHGLPGRPEALLSLLRRFTGYTPLDLLIQEGEFGGQALSLAIELLELGLIEPAGNSSQANR